MCEKKGWVLSPKVSAATYINGTVIPIDGGTSAK